MASLVAAVEDGKIVDTAASASTDSVKQREVSNSMDKEAFLKLLVAQMKYQDPLEPTSNTEYVAQLATFSELEAMTNLNESAAISRASQLVGKNVVVRTTSEATGETTQAEGMVDYVRVENGKAYLVIDEKPYLIDDLLMVVDDDYWDEYQSSIKGETSVTAQKIMAAISTLPEDNANITLEHAELITAIRKAYNEAPAEEKQQVSEDALVKLIRAENIIAKLQAEQSKNEANNNGGEGEKDPSQEDQASESQNA